MPGLIYALFAVRLWVPEDGIGRRILYIGVVVIAYAMAVFIFRSLVNYRHFGLVALGAGSLVGAVVVIWVSGFVAGVWFTLREVLLGGLSAAFLTLCAPIRYQEWLGGYIPTVWVLFPVWQVVVTVYVGLMIEKRTPYQGST